MALHIALEGSLSNRRGKREIGALAKGGGGCELKDFLAVEYQTLGWCVADDVDLTCAFYNTPCESTSCGVTQVDGGCAPTSAPKASRFYS